MGEIMREYERRRERERVRGRERERGRKRVGERVSGSGRDIQLGSRSGSGSS